MRTIKWDSRS